MESSTANDNEIRTKIKQIYLLAVLFIFYASIQWLLVNNFDIFDFLLNPWLLGVSFIALIVIASILIFKFYTETILPETLRWIMGIAFMESVVIVLSSMIKSMDHCALFISLPSIILCMIILFMLGPKIDEQLLPVFVILTFFCNALLILLILTILIATKFFADIYKIIFFIVLAIAIPILFMNLIYASMLIGYNRYEPKSVTDCLKPALYIYGIFAVLVWFAIELEMIMK